VSQVSGAILGFVMWELKQNGQSMADYCMSAYVTWKLLEYMMYISGGSDQWVKDSTWGFIIAKMQQF